MARPLCQTLGVSNMGYTVATFKGQCISTGGLPTKLSFGYDGQPWTSYFTTPKFDVPYDGWEKAYVQSGLNYTTRHNMFCIVENADGSWVGGNFVFWLPRPEDPKTGSPFLVLYSSGIFDNGTYSFVAITDVGCHLVAYVGTHKPYINEEINLSGGTTWRHKPGLVFNWHYKIEQNEEGDTLAHTFVIPYSRLDQTYWFVLMGMVDGYPSPSISPFFKFRRYSLPSLDCVPAFGITATEAYIGGKLQLDYGAGVYLKLRYTKVEEYTDYTDQVGPYRSMWQHTEKITGLDPDTNYKFSIVGSHDKDMLRYGWSEPCFFKTEPPPFGPEQTYNCKMPAYPLETYSLHATFAGCRAGLKIWGGGEASYSCGYRTGGYAYILHRGVTRFNTDIIPSGSKINSVTLRMKCMYDDWGGNPPKGCTMQLLKAPGYSGDYSTAYWFTMGTFTDVILEKYYAAYTAWTLTDFEFPENMLDYIVPGVKTPLCMRTAEDISGVDLGPGNNYFRSVGFPNSTQIMLIVKACPPL